MIWLSLKTAAALLALKVSPANYFVIHFEVMVQVFCYASKNPPLQAMQGCIKRMVRKGRRQARPQRTSPQAFCLQQGISYKPCSIPQLLLTSVAYRKERIFLNPHSCSLRTGLVSPSAGCYNIQNPNAVLWQKLPGISVCPHRNATNICNRYSYI